MTTTTDVYWSIDGTPLQTLCQGVESLSPKWRLPEHRGENLEIAYQHGTNHTLKWLKDKVESLGLWITDSTPDGSARVGNSRRRQFEKNIRDLRALVFREYAEQVTLTKRWVDPDSGAVISASAQAELTSDMDLNMIGPYGAKVVLDFRLAKPFYLAEAETVTIEAGATEEITLLGDLTTDLISIKFNGVLSNPELINSTPTPNPKLKFGGAIADEDSVTVDAQHMTATRESDGANMISAITRSGQPQFFVLKPGTNELSLEVASGAGDVELTYHPLYL